jgi:hypothetical protein
VIGARQHLKNPNSSSEPFKIKSSNFSDSQEKEDFWVHLKVKVFILIYFFKNKLFFLIFNNFEGAWTCKTSNKK